MPNLRGSEWLIIILLVVLLFGAKRLPDAARSIGRSLRIFKAETKGLSGDDPAQSGPAQSTSAQSGPAQTHSAQAEQVRELPASNPAPPAHPGTGQPATEPATQQPQPPSQA